VFKTPQNDQQMSLVIVRHMIDTGVKTVGFIGFQDAYGEGWWNEFSKIAETRKLKIVANERYQRTDTSVTGQVLKLVAARPDAILIAASGTPAALPQKALKERGYTGKIYQTHGVANNDFLRVCGKDCEGTFIPAGPMLVSDQLPNDHPVRKSAVAYVEMYEKAHGKGSISTFGGHGWDTFVLLQAALPGALKKAQPGTKEFRAALRDSLENVRNAAGAHGIFNMSPTDHLGLDQRAAVMVQVRDGKWVLQK
jgi:branched-chain amino acid transport system substrate-binding protein